jgi:hypothetical protein
MPPQRVRLATTLLAVLLLCPALLRGAPPLLAQEVPQGTRTHDWRRPGYVGAVGGVIYDPECVPLRSAGANVPNLPYRQGVGETLAWLRQHNHRWLRVVATGHALASDRAPRGQSGAVAALRSLLRQVEAFNATVPPGERIYVLVALTDYYTPAVPGDRLAFDHPRWRGSAVLPAPWYRAGVFRFDFVQEHGLGRLVGMPNYEVNFKPWVQELVTSLAPSPALMGWQLGNELKARGSPRNGIAPDEAYAWYLDFTRDVVDTIRAADSNHLIYMGAQYTAELVDWEYRPNGDPPPPLQPQYRPDGDPLPDLLPQYRGFVQQALDACGTYCWNVWGLTNYDFGLYALDDAAAMGAAGVPSVLTEYGFTLGTPEENVQRFGGDRIVALREGVPRPWTDLEGRRQTRQWGVRELMERAPMAGVASWGAPAPGQEAGFDVDRYRGITGAPDEGPLWAAWQEMGAWLETANREAGPSAACQAHVSPRT